jgi:lipoprotein-anchoring transpeptidase ErfK/SrfK
MRGRITAALAFVIAASGCGAAAPADRPAAQAEGAQAGAFQPVRERRAAPKRPKHRWVVARVTGRSTLRARPGGRVIARIGTRTEFGSPRVLAVTGRRGAWLRVVATEHPNGGHAWLPAAHARLAGTDFSLHVDRSRRELTLRHGGEVLRRLPVAVGRPDTPTPLGRFAVTDMLHTGRADSPYGCCAIALSGHQTQLLPGWPGGDRLAIHATPQPDTIGKAVSLGCMRALARDVRALMRRVPLGTPVFVRA